MCTLAPLVLPPFNRDHTAEILQQSTANLPETQQLMHQQRATLNELQRVNHKFESLVGLNIPHRTFHLTLLQSSKTALNYFWRIEADHENALMASALEAAQQWHNYPSKEAILTAIAPHWRALDSIRREAAHQVCAQIGKKADDIFLSESEKQQLIAAKEKIVFQRMKKATEHL